MTGYYSSQLQGVTSNYNFLSVPLLLSTQPEQLNITISFSL